MESLKERLVMIDSVQSKRPCRVREIKETLDEDVAQILEDLLTKSKTSLRAIHAELRVSDIRVAREALGVHRNNWCGCKETETV